ncbi:hypothetical protein [Arthrobacter sp. JSM 101049]|uniref:hypothetical protein n=1 Tax=Arthrobacter sp. JSM 101049 TaxID=929097 RepID=UPI0035624F0A
MTADQRPAPDAAPAPGPGVAWLARRTGVDPAELTASPEAAVSALRAAARQIAVLAAKLESGDPATRAAAQAEADRLVQDIDGGPSPGQTFARRVTGLLRDGAR